MAEIRKIRPQPGPQERFLGSSADIALYGGEAGGGKTYGLLLEPTRHVFRNKDFAAIIFRRTTTDIRNPGGLWDESMDIYAGTAGKPVDNVLEWRWGPSGGKIKMAHLEYDKTRLDYQGAQIPLICSEENERIKTGDGKHLAIKDVVVGDVVMTLSGPRRVSVVGPRRLEDCVRMDMGGECQVHSTTHKVLTSTGWVSYADTFGESHPFLSSLSTLSHSVGIFLLRTYSKFQSFQPSPCSRIGRWPRTRRLSRSRAGRLFSSVISSYMARLARGICSATFGSVRAAIWQLSSVTLSGLVRHAPSQPLSGPSSSPDSSLDEASCVQSACKQEGCLDGCSSYTHPNDEPCCPAEGTRHHGVQPQGGVGAQTRTGSPSGDRGKVQRRIHRKLRYAHPYTGEEQIAEEAVFFDSCRVTPCGQKYVIDITVDDCNHYITKGGIVNRNCFDELTHFTAKQFWYMLSRNRSTCGVKPYIRATCNPDADSWVAELIAWWLDDDGFAIPERSGVIRWFIRLAGVIIWGDTREELIDEYGAEVLPKSFTFIHSSLSDNQILMEKDPGYLANLQALDQVERARLLDGNWKIRPAAGLYFNRSWVEVVDRAPPNLNLVRYWDLAATEKTSSNNPDWTVGVKMGFDETEGVWYVLDVIRRQWSSGKVETLIKETAESDGKGVAVGYPQDPGQAGKAQAKNLAKMLVGYIAEKNIETGSKVVRFRAASAQFEHGNIRVVRGGWNDTYFGALEGFPEYGLDDGDATSGAFDMLSNTGPLVLCM